MKQFLLGLFGGGFLILLILRSCGTPESPEPTIITKTTIDTFFVYDTLVHTQIKYKPVPYAVRDTVWGDTTSDLIAVRNYSNHFGDSVVGIDVSTEIVGVMNQQEVAWKLNLPPSTHRIDSVFIMASPERKRSLYIGFIAGTDTTLVPSLLYEDKKRRKFVGGYDVLNKTIKAGVFVPIK